MTLPQFSDLLLLLRPGAQFVCRGPSLAQVEWMDAKQTMPTQAEVDAGLANITVLNYAQLRVQAYPPIGDQLDALWTGGQAATDMLAKIQAVKAKYPKGA